MNNDFFKDYEEYFDYVVTPLEGDILNHIMKSHCELLETDIEPISEEGVKKVLRAFDPYHSFSLREIERLFFNTLSKLERRRDYIGEKYIEEFGDEHNIDDVSDEFIKSRIDEEKNIIWEVFLDATSRTDAFYLSDDHPYDLISKEREYLETLYSYAEGKFEKERILALLCTKSFSGQEAADILGISKNSINSTVRKVYKKAIGEISDDKEVLKKKAGGNMNIDKSVMESVPKGFKAVSMSTLKKDSSTGEMQWVKVVAENKQSQDIVDMFRELFEEIEHKSDPEQYINYGFTTKNQMTLYPLGDLHLGLRTCKEAFPEQTLEVNGDYGVTDTERVIDAAVTRLVELSPHTEEAVIMNLGDYFHCDNQENVTRKSRNTLQVDGEWGRNFKLGVKFSIALINKALQKHKKVKVYNLIGNHDEQSSISLSIALDCYYSKDERVEVNTDMSPFKFMEYGVNLIGMAHGDGVKQTNLGGIMSTDVPEMWGRTKQRKWYVGHVHHKSMLELPGCVVETFRSLAPKDNWHYKSGYRAGRDVVCIVLDKDYGEVERHTVNITQIKDIIERDVVQ